MGDIACPTCGTPNAAGDEVCRSCAVRFSPPPSTAESRRVVTVLFSDVTGSTAMGEQSDPELLRRVLVRYFGEMQAVLERHGATVEKYIGDAVMAVFGLPRAHEDDALRAVRAATEMREALDVLNAELTARWGVTIRTRTGLNTGEVLAGEPSAQQSLVVGDAVNVAARLEQSAEPGDILIGDATYRLVRDAVVVEPVGPLSVKGKSRPVSTWRLVSVLPVTAGRTRRLDSPLVGREAELAAITAAYRRVLDTASGQVVTVVGGAGVGKSRLTAEFLRSVSGEARVAVGRCPPYGEGITFRPVIEVVRALLEITDEEEPAAVRARLGALLGSAADAEMVGERMAALLAIGETPLSVQETFWAVRRFYEQLAQTRPLVVVIDDIHWAETTLLDLFEYLTDWLASAHVLLVCLARSELLDARPGWLSGRDNSTLLRLEPLPEGAVDTLIGNLLDGGDLAPETGRRIAAVAEGNPLFVEETLRMLVDDGLLHVVDGRWSVTDPTRIPPFPPTIQALITARLDRLDDEERGVVERASVAGRVFWWGAVSELISPELQPSVGRSLQSLSRKELIRPGRSDLPGEDAFEFTHVLVKDAAYAAIPKELRAYLHERLAAWLQGRAGSWAESHEEVVGYHFEQAHLARRELGAPLEGLGEAGRRAAELLASSGRRAFTRGDMPAAVNLLTRAAGLLPASEPACLDVLPRLAFALMETGDFERLVEVVSEMGGAATAAGDPRMVAHATILELYVRLFTSPQSWADEAEREARDALATFERVADEHGLSKGWSLLGLVHVWKGQFGDAREAWEEAAAHAATAGEWRDELEALSWVLLAMWAGPTPVGEGLRRAHEVIERAGTNHKGRASGMFMRAVLEAAQGRPDVARALIEQARGLLQEVALTVWAAGPLTQMAGFVELGAEQAVEAERQLRWGSETLEKVGEMAWMPTIVALLAQAVYVQGRVDEADELATRSAQLAGSEDVVSQILWRRVLAFVRARSGQSAEAEALSRESVALAEATDSLFLQGEALLGLAEVLEHLGHADLARQAAEDAAARFERKGDVQGARRARRVLAPAGVQPRPGPVGVEPQPGSAG